MNATSGLRGARRNPADLERDSDAIRADMDRTIEAIESKFSPREVVDRSLDYVRDHGAEIAERVGETVRANPIPVAMTAAGLIWLTASLVRQQGGLMSESSGADDAGRRYGAEEADEENDWEEAGEVNGEASRAQPEDVRSTPRIVGHRLARSARAVGRQVGEARHSAAQSVAEQPVFWGMLALAAGALLGSALPASEYEKRALLLQQRRPAEPPGSETQPNSASEDTSVVDKGSVTYGA